ncbi:MAG TPA: metallophosphoesterase [Bdellovibrionota bacterium]|jgi:Icc-related predicted phosphoesterase
MIRVAAVGDVHFDRSSGGRLKNYLPQIEARADLLLLAGDLTQTGHLDEARVLADDLACAAIPVAAVLGNHDFHLGQDRELVSMLESRGIVVLEGEAVQFPVRDTMVGVAGIKGFGGGFPGACASEFGESEMKEFIRTTKRQAELLREALLSLQTPYRIALMHYSPVPDTLEGERLEIYPFLGSYLLSEVVDDAEVDIVFHGHAHKGKEKGETVGGVPVRNVAQPVIHHVCNFYSLNKEGVDARSTGIISDS